MSQNGLYRDIILDYYRNPRNKGRLDPHDFEAQDINPLCGDEIGIQGRVENGTIAELKFDGRGCAISQASVSMLTELAKGKPVEWVKSLSKDDIFKMLGVEEIGPSRIKCALLGMKVLKMGAYSYLGEHLEDQE